jgi:hypothetical protein
VILGLLSDTHGRQDAARRAIKVLQQAGAQAFVHCGDVGGAGVFNELAGLRAWFVWGNSDDAGPLLRRHVQSLGLEVPAEVPLRLELAGKTIAVYHGHEQGFERFARLADGGRVRELEELTAVDYLLFGHTHKLFDERFGRLRAVSPGALFRVAVPSVATLDLRRDEVRFWEVPAELSAGRPLRQLRCDGDY